MQKIFLKFNREEDFSFECLNYWIDVFKNDNIYIITDLFEKNSIPESFKKRISDYTNTKILNSNYSLPDTYIPIIKKEAVKKLASPNLTCFEYIEYTDKHYWVIDADDTRFLSNDPTYIRSKLIECERILEQESLDAFSLDFYRCLDINAWTYGVCLVSTTLNKTLLKNISQDNIKSYGLVLNFDSIVDILGREQLLKLKSFVFDKTKFQHVVNRYPKLADGIYYWANRKLWNTPLREDIVVI
jgi:hypothetical protein